MRPSKGSLLFFTALAALPLLAMACSGGDDDRFPIDGSRDGGPPIQGTDGATGTSDGGLGDGATGEGGDDDGGNVPDARPDGPIIPPLDPAVCAPGGTWATGTTLPLSTADEDWLGTITTDELSIAWMSRASGGALTVHYAERERATDAFGTPRTLSGTPYAFDRAALRDDGLRLVLVNADRRGFTQLTRDSREDAFGSPGDGPLEAINVTGADMPAGDAYGDPVFAPDDHKFYYSRYGNGRVDTIYVATHLLPDLPFTEGFVAMDTTNEVKAVGGQRRRPTGFSHDMQTFFFWDEVGGTARAGHFTPLTNTFDSFDNLGARPNAMPNASCTRLYYSTTDLFVAPRP